MLRMSFVASLLLVSLSVGTSRGDTLPLFSNVPAEYVPGTPFTFQIVLPDVLSTGSQMNGLSQFTVGLVFDTNLDSPPLTVNAAIPASGYVFPGSTTFVNDPFLGPGSNEVSVDFSDSSSSFVTVGPGQDVLADITVTPDITMTDPITVSFTDYTSITYFGEGFDVTPPSITIDQGTPPPPAVPVPASWIGVAIGTVILAGRKRIWG